ncbi:MAG: hypothetical protein FWC51_02040 [Proteobacteria bacterium]|nr:hypothetical protein [Pseudomonadota bacterium]
MKFRDLMVRSIPYILSVLGGLIIYIMMVRYSTDENFNGLVSNIAASLLAIPLIFLLYEYVNYKLSRSVNEKLAESMTFDVNAIVLRMLKILRKMMNIKNAMSWEMIQRMLRMRAKEIKAAAKITKEDIDQLRAEKKEMNELAYKLARAGILSENQIQIIVQITKEAAHTVNEYEYKGDTAMLAKYIESLLDAIDDWFDAIERESLQLHQQFQLTIEQEARETKSPQRPATGDKSAKA